MWPGHFGKLVRNTQLPVLPGTHANAMQSGAHTELREIERERERERERVSPGSLEAGKAHLGSHRDTLESIRIPAYVASRPGKLLVGLQQQIGTYYRVCRATDGGYVHPLKPPLRR